MSVLASNLTGTEHSAIVNIQLAQFHYIKTCTTERRKQFIKYTVLLLPYKIHKTLDHWLTLWEIIRLLKGTLLRRCDQQQLFQSPQQSTQHQVKCSNNWLQPAREESFRFGGEHMLRGSLSWWPCSWFGTSQPWGRVQTAGWNTHTHATMQRS